MSYQKFLESIPENKLGKLKLNSYYFWIVRRKDWNDNKPQRLRMKYDRAMHLAMLVNYTVIYALNQEVDKDKLGAPKSQKALIYGTGKQEIPEEQMELL